MHSFLRLFLHHLNNSVDSSTWTSNLDLSLSLRSCCHSWSCRMSQKKNLWTQAAQEGGLCAGVLTIPPQNWALCFFVLSLISLSPHFLQIPIFLQGSSTELSWDRICVSIRSPSFAWLGNENPIFSCGKQIPAWEGSGAEEFCKSQNINIINNYQKNPSPKMDCSPHPSPWAECRDPKFLEMWGLREHQHGEKQTFS